MAVSLHSHSGQFCSHAHGTLEEVVQCAVARGFRIYGLSEHQPRNEAGHLYPEEVEKSLSPKDLHATYDRFVIEARRLQTIYRDKITLLVAMETEFIDAQSLLDATALVQRHKLDYLVGSVHHVGGVPIDFSEEMYLLAAEKAGSMDQLFCNYFDQQYTMLTNLRPRVVAHLDLVRMYRPLHSLSTQVWDKIRRNVNYIVCYGGWIEINSRALKKKLPSPYPLPDILEFCISTGAKFTLSDDSHGPNDVGMHYVPLLAHLRKYGIHTVHALQRQGDELAEVEISVLNDTFWQTFTHTWP